MYKFATILAASASLAAAAPTEGRNNKVAARQDAQNPGYPEVFPSGTYVRYINSGETVSDPQDQLLVVKNGNFEDESSTIVTFQFDEDTEGLTCQLNFELSEDDTSTGTKTMDVFTWTNPEDLEALIAGENLKKPETKSRDEQAGRVAVSAPGRAGWTMTYGDWPAIPCPAGQLIGIEYVGVGDRVEVGWDSGVTGPRFWVIDPENPPQGN